MSLTAIYGRELWQDHEIVDAIQAWAAEHGEPPTGLAWRKAGFGHPTACTVRAHFGTMAAALRAAGFDAVERSGGYEPYWTKELIAAAFLDFSFTHGRWPTERDWWQPHHGPRTGGAHRPGAGTVRRVFGTWNAARLYAGWTGEEHCKHCRCPRDSRTRGCAACIGRHGRRRAKRAAALPLRGPGGLSRNGGGTPSLERTVAA